MSAHWIASTGELYISMGSSAHALDRLATPAEIDAWRVAGLAKETLAAATAIKLEELRIDASIAQLLTQLKDSNPQQITAFITAQVTDLPSARAVLIRMAIVLAVLVRKNF